MNKNSEIQFFKLNSLYLSASIIRKLFHKHDVCFFWVKVFLTHANVRSASSEKTPQLMSSECRSSGGSELSCSCCVEPCGKLESCTEAATDWPAVSVSLSGPACAEQSATCLDLGVTCAFVLKGGKPCGLRDAGSRSVCTLCVRPSVPSSCQTLERQSEGDKNVESLHPNKKHSFLCPLRFALGFFFS